ncbi:MAG: xanthine dehydrogenase family protein subunit [Acidobacteria bacterium]|nr:xanthine dehydrogenase family protein subunit [Acidobacteriota bacterium]
MDLPVRQWLRPASLDEAVALLAANPRARAVAGGTDLVVQLRDGRRSAEALVDLSHLGLAGIDERDGGLEIGAGTPMAEIAGHPAVRRLCPALAAAAGLVGAWLIQNRATLGGNLANASPAADTVPPLMVGGAEVAVVGRDGRRTIAVDELFLGPGRTALAADELIVSVYLPSPPPGRVVERFAKVGPRREQIIAMVSLAGRAVVGAGGSLATVRIALGAVAPTPMRARRAEAFLTGRRPDPETVREAVRQLELDIAPIDDVRAPASYRRIAAAVLLDRFLEACRG